MIIGEKKKKKKKGEQWNFDAIANTQTQILIFRTQRNKGISCLPRCQDRNAELLDEQLVVRFPVR